MTSTQLTIKLAQRLNITQTQARNALDTITAIISAALIEGDSVSIAGLGKFACKLRKAREGINPVTKQRIDIPSITTPSFSPSQTLKDAVRSK